MEHTPKDKMIVRAVIALVPLFFMVKAISIGVEVHREKVALERISSGAVRNQVAIAVENGYFDDDGLPEADKGMNPLSFLALMVIAMAGMVSLYALIRELKELR